MADGRRGGQCLRLSSRYAYGRLAWNPADDAQDILQDWIKLTFGLDRKVLDQQLLIRLVCD
jgi:alpha-glucuronidase